MNLSIKRQRRVVNLIRWVMFLALVYLTTAGGTSSVVQGVLLALVAASNIALTRISDALWEHPALLPVIAGLDTLVLVAAMWAGQGFARDFFFAYFAHLAVVALAGNLRNAIVATSLVLGAYGSFLALQHGVDFLATPRLVGRLGFLFSIGVGYGGLIDASRSRMREAALQGQLVGWVSKLSAAFSDDFEALDVIRQVLVDTQEAYPGNARASLVQIEDRRMRVIGSSDDDEGTFELTPERYPELVEVITRGESIVIDDIRSDPITGSVREFVQDLPFNALLLCPVDLEDNDFGHVILRVARKGPSFSPSIVKTTEHVAEAIGIIFRQAKMREAMERSEKMEMVSQVTSSVAHSFNGILSTVLLSSQGLRKAAQEHDATARCGLPVHDSHASSRYEAIDTATKEGLTIVERLGAWTRLGTRGDDSESTVVLGPQKLFEETWRYAEPIWTKRVQTRALELEWECDPSVPAIEGNQTELREVLLNLILNAIDAMPKGGVLSLGLHHDDDGVVFSVRDSGTGIDSDVLDRIFDPMFSTKGSAGTGLGLSLARSIAERHGGTLEVETAIGVGSCFRLRVPVATARPERLHTNDEPTSPEAPIAGSRVLLAESSELVRDVMVRAIEGAGFDVDVVADLEEAEVMLGARSGYAGLIADAAASEAQAHGFLQRLRAQHDDLSHHVVFYSAGTPSPAMATLQESFGVECFDRTAGLAGLHAALAALVEHRDAA